ncbi:DapH/DapD/GlmU-related protein [Achromobacter aegrifaciens]|uniref:DapH/DapD/GlmU-related protein n=1 Tax=Achromobacter aegrifaciens TaxID=1287736 RepID=UPI001467F526|nr:DapH/DapD/GlmU-related protein [Achromobacter aegrifaciens]CAB3664961.1 UDP-3-O-(3-hydroxymyristoyl)glucosamine N-acyltransferase [Achromobacter aegrifaciens]
MQANQRGGHPLPISDFFPAEAIIRDGSFATLDEVDTSIAGSLVYCQTLHYLQKAAENACVSAILCPRELTGELTDSAVAVIAADDPRRWFFDLYLRLTTSGEIFPEMDFGIGQDCLLHPSAVISPKALLGNRVVVGPHAVIEDYCRIGDDVEIGPNVVIGAEGLLTIRRPDGSLMRIRHAGGVEVGDGCQILAGVVIAKSLFRRFTRIGKHGQVGIMTNIGHGAQVGDECVVSGNSVVAGRSHLGNRVWVGTSASIAQGLTIGEGAQIKMGAVVVADVPAGATVSGNFAVNHRINMARYIKGAV